MDRDITARFKTMSGIVKAIARNKRIFIVVELAEGKRCICEINHAIDWNSSTFRLLNGKVRQCP